jgi:cell division protein FtsW
LATRKRKKGSFLFVWGEMDYAFLLIVVVLMSIGLVMLFSASYANALYYMGDSLHYISRQVAFAVGGVICMLGISRINYRILKPLTLPIYGVTILLLILVLFMPPINGVRRWIPIPLIGTLQPSEVAKFALVLMYASYISVYHQKMHTFKYGLLPFGAILAPVVFLLLKEPHLSATVLMIGITGVMMFVGGTDYRWFLVAAGAAGVLIAVVIISPDIVRYAGGRVETWLDPFADPQGYGFQTIQSLYAIGSGGLTGAGIGGSRQKYLYLPEAQNDFIFAVVAEELGFIGSTLILCLFALLIWRGFVIAMRCRDRFGCMVAVGITAQVGIQTILNVAVVTNTVPNTGISLPFFSYGGTALLMLLCEMGVVLSVSRCSALEKE